MKFYVDKLPESCRYCDLCKEKEYDHEKRLEGDKFCAIDDSDVTHCCEQSYYGNDYIPDGCKLRELPKRMKYADSSHKKDMAYVLGWNSYRDELLEGE